MDIIKGANAPLIRQTILNELEQEKRVMANLHQRNTVRIRNPRIRNPRIRNPRIRNPCIRNSRL